MPVTIKKYANRRLYNTATSKYVTLDHLAQMVKEGVEFVVYDAKSGDDITRSVLTQIIVEEYNRISKLGGAHKEVTLRIHRIGSIDGALVVERTDEIVLNGVKGECPVVGVLEFTGDKIALWRDYYDRAQLERAAGHATVPRHS